MLTIEEQIVAWAAERPRWQQTVLKRLAAGEWLKEADYRDIAEKLVAPERTDTGVLALEDLGGRAARSKSAPSLRAIRDVAHVNALATDQQLEFGPTGITVVYGDNGSGKSGYARLIKSVVRALHREDVRSNIFASRPKQPASATLVFEHEGKEKSISWPSGDVTPLSRVCFYDEACGDQYVTVETEMGFRPSALALLDGLIRACDGVRAALDEAAKDSATERDSLPSLHRETRAGLFLAGLSGRSAIPELDALCSLPADATEQVARLLAEANRLDALDPARERTRLLALASKLDILGHHIDEAVAILGPASEIAMSNVANRLAAAEAAAKIASATSFSDEPLRGVGSDTWKVLWQAARKYAEGPASTGVAFPDTSASARCVLCQQPLDDEASERLRRFETSIQNSVGLELAAAESEVRACVAKLQAFNARPAHVEFALEGVQESHTTFVEDLRGLLSTSEARKDALLKSVQGALWLPPTAPAPSAPGDRAQSLAAAVRARAQGVAGENYAETARVLEAQAHELEASGALAAARPAVVEEIERAAKREAIANVRGETATNSITSKSAELLRAHVTPVVRDRFTRETQGLRLERVTLNDVSARKGAVRQQAGFVGAQQEAPLRSVLSEGEQTALGLAGFFTEAHLDDSGSPLVLDDPVSSLDHGRRQCVARRLAEFAKERQVIVFTHDISLVTDIIRQARYAGVELTERRVERFGGKKPGTCFKGLPWRAKDAPRRLRELEQDLAQLKRDEASLTQEAYVDRVATWAGRMSQTWERLVGSEVVGQVFDVAAHELRPKLFRVLARITDADDTEFQHSYGRCSGWAPRHDQAPDMNYNAPTLTELEEELVLVKVWWDRVRKYSDYRAPPGVGSGLITKSRTRANSACAKIGAVGISQ